MPYVNERDIDRVGDYNTDEQVAELLGISLGRLRNKLCAAGQVVSTGTQLSPDAASDAPLLAMLQPRDFDAISREGGCGGHEIRTWVAVAAAAEVAGCARFERRYYRAIPEWITG